MATNIWRFLYLKIKFDIEKNDINAGIFLDSDFWVLLRVRKIRGKMKLLLLVAWDSFRWVFLQSSWVLSRWKLCWSNKEYVKQQIKKRNSVWLLKSAFCILTIIFFEVWVLLATKKNSTSFYPGKIVMSHSPQTIIND